MRKKTSEKEDSVKIGFVLMLLSLGLLIAYIFLNPLSKSSTSENNLTSSAQIDQNKGNLNINDFEWEEYKNEDSGFSIEHPKYLYVRESKDQGGYQFFVRFEETNFSLQKGVGIGLSDKNLREEIAGIKTMFTKDGGKLIKEEQTSINGIVGMRLDFEPAGEGEKRSIYVFQKGDTIFSLSTVPDQLDRVVRSFKILD